MVWNMNRIEAEERLKSTFGIAHFYDEQWNAIEKILKGERVLMIERTGFGKSLCYQFPATIFRGITVIFSPLIALMRDQVKNLKSRGISAAFINSEQTPEENTESINKALAGKIKILYIAPERQENREWIDATRNMHLSMVVIDEAHTISTWGHDFRPSFRRIIDLVQLLHASFPVFATTATATKRVQHDIENQIGGKITTIRGPLIRENFNLYVIRVNSEEEKMVWLADNINKLSGTGLIYTGTRIATDDYARWLKYVGIDATSYNAGYDAATRMDIENGLMENRWKCVVSTNALGMGIDKSDIRFVIHTQIPASPIHYYQEIGRAGRDGKPTTIILFFNESKDSDGIMEDYKLPRAFIDGARPSEKKYYRVLEVLKEKPLGERSIIKSCNLKQNEVRVIKADLIEQGIIKEVLYNKSKKYEYQYGAKELDTSGFETLRQAKINDLNSMVGYIYTTQPRMKYLCNFLDSSDASVYQNCDNTNLVKLNVNKDSVSFTKLQSFREAYFPVLEMKGDGEHLVDGIAASYYGVSNVGAAIHRSKYEGYGDFPDYLLKLTLKAFGKTFGRDKFDMVMFVPPTCSGDLVKNFAVKFASVLRLPVEYSLTKKRITKEQKIFQNNYNKKDNVLNAFNVHKNIVEGKRIILIDDIYDSGATLKEIGNLLINKGALQVVPITIAKTVGGTL